MKGEVDGVVGDEQLTRARSVTIATLQDVLIKLRVADLVIVTVRSRRGTHGEFDILAR